MSYVYLGMAIILEVFGTTCMKLSQGFARPLFSALTFLFYGLCFGSFILALRKLDLSLAYAIWAGLGTALVATVGMTYFKEPVSVVKLVSLGVIIAGVVGLHLSGR